jgi:hypothetical protein
MQDTEGLAADVARMFASGAAVGSDTRENLETSFCIGIAQCEIICWHNPPDPEPLPTDDDLSASAERPL